MSVQLSSVLATARMYLNDDNATVWSDPVLIPKAQEAHRELQTELWIAGSPVVRASLQVTYTGGAFVLNSVPADMLCPIRLVEGPNAGNGPWTPMTEISSVADLRSQGVSTAQTGTLRYWAFTGEGISLIGANTNLLVEVTYRRLITIPILTTDVIGILFGELYMAPRVAALCNGALGNEAGFKEMTAVAKENFGKVVLANRGSQKPLVRPA